jgi:hypothetical protein
MAATNASKMAGAKNDVVSDTKEVVEDVKELVEDAVELVELRTSWLMRNPKYLAMGAVLAGVVIGSTATYLVVRKKLSAKYQAIANEEIESVKKHFAGARFQVDPKPPLEKLAEKAERDDALETVKQIKDASGYSSYDKVPPTVEAPTSAPLVEQATVVEAEPEGTIIEHNVFDSEEPETYFNEEEELIRRRERPNEPFVITSDEYDENDTDFQQITLAYYDGDDTLTDEVDTIVPDVDATVGVENMLRFGHGSGDPNVVYIRNPKLEADFEVTRSAGKYAKEVLGYDDGEHLQHSRGREPRKFRDRHDR